MVWLQCSLTPLQGMPWQGNVLLQQESGVGGVALCYGCRELLINLGFVILSGFKIQLSAEEAGDSPHHFS